MNNFHPDHIADLKKSGLSDETITQAGICIVMPPRQIDKKLGFNMPGLISMYEIPYPDCDGFSRFRCFYENGKSGPKYLQRKGTGNHLYIPAMIDVSVLSDTTKPIYFTEGEKKALKACQEGIPCIGLSGLWNWKIKDGGLIPDFNKINFKHRKVFIVPDNDYKSPNKHGYGKNLEQAVNQLAVGLIERGATVSIIELPDGLEKGLDDYLCNQSVAEFFELPEKEVRTLTIKEIIEAVTIDSLDEVLKRVAKVKSQVKQEAIISDISKKLKVSKSSIKNDLKKYGAHFEVADTTKNGRKMIALFPGLADIVDDDGKPAFLIKDNFGLHIETSVEIDGVQYIPPGKEHLPFALPQADQCLSYYQTDDPNLFDDIMAYFRQFSYLPDDQWLIVVLYVFQTYLQDHLAIHYMAELLFYAVPERGKSRTGKAVAYISYRGVHVVDMRETNIFRYSGNLGATIFFDIMDLWKKAERNQSEDILLLRFEKGARVPRVLYPEKGAFQDTVYYPVYGPTVMASNEPVHKILGSRCILFPMPNAPGNYENPTPELALDIKARLTVWRAKKMNKELPEVQPIKGISGRLWDITIPLFQLCKVICPEKFGKLKAAILNISGERTQDKKESFDGLIVQVLSEMANGNADTYDIKTSDLTTKFNELWQGDKEINERSIGRRLKALGVHTDTKTGHSTIRITQNEINILKEQYGFISARTSENNSDNSEKSKEHTNPNTCTPEFLKGAKSETQKTQKKLKGENDLLSTTFETPEFPEFLHSGNNENLREVEI